VAVAEFRNGKAVQKHIEICGQTKTIFLNVHVLKVGFAAMNMKKPELQVA